MLVVDLGTLLSEDNDLTMVLAATHLIFLKVERGVCSSCAVDDRPLGHNFVAVDVL